MNKKPFIIIISGPTASGKSALALNLTLQINGEIISADSRQVYDEFDIGVNKPPKLMLDEVPHHLIGNVPVKEAYSASKFREDATRHINEIFAKGKIPIICGGTGLYIRMLLQGADKMPPSDPLVREKLMEQADNEGLEPLYERLKEIDPEYAAVISPNDSLRTVRALEIYELSGHNMSYFSSLFSESEYEYIHFILDIDRKKLYDSINRRTQEMLGVGLVDEVRRLSAKYGDNAILHTIGYAEVVEYLRGEITYERMAELIAQHTRNYAKRQVIWNRKVIKNDTKHVVVLHEPNVDNMVKILKERGFVL